jgi:TRAP-type C4-dicarboxylate transport system permease small subunit
MYLKEYKIRRNKHAWLDALENLLGSLKYTRVLVMLLSGLCLFFVLTFVTFPVASVILSITAWSSILLDSLSIQLPDFPFVVK